MQKLLTFLLVPLLTTVCPLSSVITAEAESKKLESPKLGEAAPKFSLTDTKGKTYSLSNLKGKIVVLEWFNAGCPFVKKHYETDTMQKLQAEYGGKENIVWLSIVSSAEGKQGHMANSDHDKQLSEWKSRAEALLIDADGNVGRAYGAMTTPHMFIINAEGTLVYMGAIDDKPTVKHSDVEGATNYVKNALDALLAGKDIQTASTKPYGCSVKY